MIVATAGHIDHGKTALIKALTGTDTTHLPEERRRGMTIDLGFASMPLPGGGIVSFVDVPGHERFVRNMLAGIGGIDLALLVVAADDGIMPQTLEHLEILDLIGVARGAVALTKIDRVQAERLHAVAADLDRLLAPTALAGAPIFPVAALEGIGIPALRDHLAATASAPPRRRPGAFFRLPTDRCFVVDGVGIVVTGTIAAGAVAVEDRLVLMPSGRELRVRGLQMHGAAVAQCSAGHRCALNLAAPSLDRTAIRRGDWLVAPEIAIASDRLDARITAPPGAQMRLRQGSAIHLHHGAGDTTARLFLLDANALPPGGSALAQLVLDSAVHALRGDRFVLRDGAALHTLAGGTVLDPFPPSRGRRQKPRLDVLAAHEAEDAGAALARLLAASPDGVDLGRFAQAWNLAADEAELLWSGAGLTRVETAGGERGIDAAVWGELRRSLLAAVDAAHAAEPDSPGPPAAELLRLDMPGTGRLCRGGALAMLVRERALLREGPRLRRPDHAIGLAPSDHPLWQRIGPLIGIEPRPMTLHDIAAALKLDPKTVEGLLERAARAGLATRLTQGRYLERGALATLARLAEAVAAQAPDRLFDAARYRDRSRLGRNVVIELLEHFDRIGLTRRIGNARRIARPAADLFPAAEG